jgi:hypothetical protein
MSTTFEKYAQNLAIAATTGKKENLVAVVQPFTKSANLSAYLQDPTVQRYLMGGLGGAGLGALVGYMQPDRKKRKALNYGLMGGLGGLGLAHLLGSGTGTPTAAIQNQAAPTAVQRATQEAIGTAVNLPKALVTPAAQLPRFEPTGNVYVDAAGHTGQTLRDMFPVLNKQSPVATAVGTGIGAAGGRLLGRNASAGLQRMVDNSNTAALAKTKKMFPVYDKRVARQIGRNTNWARGAKRGGPLVNLLLTGLGTYSGAVAPTTFSGEAPQ